MRSPEQLRAIFAGYRRRGLSTPSPVNRRGGWEPLERRDRAAREVRRLRRLIRSAKVRMADIDRVRAKAPRGTSKWRVFG